MKKFNILLILLLLLSINTFSQESQPVAYAVFKDSTLTFYYGQNKPAGAFDVENLITIQLDYGNYYNKEWYSVREQIKTVVFDKSLKKYRPNNCSYWFDHCNNLTSIQGIAENLYTSEVTDMAYMFSACDHLTTLDVSEFNTNNVTDMACMFWRCEKLTNLDVSSFNTENVASMWMMFEGCENLTCLDLSGFHTENLINMNGMFLRCENLTSVDLSGFNTDKVIEYDGLFAQCSNLKSIYVGEGWNTSNVTEAEYMFSGCYNLVGGQGTKYDPSHTDASYAHIDGGTSNPGYFTKNSAEERFVDSVVNSLTIEQKIGQLNQVTARGVEEMEKLAAQGLLGSILNESNLDNLNRIQKAAVDNPPHIPVLISRDVIHGYKTIFPIPLGQAASFNPELVRRGSEISAVEAASDGIRWTFSPMLDIARDPRWGRIAEGYGEDPYLTSVMGAAAVKGYQGNDLSNPQSIAACAKHFVGYGAAVGGRDYNSTYIPMRQLRNVYLPPFRAAAEAGCSTYMSSFNDNDGVPSTGNKLILTDILRNEWGFDGFVVSDWFAIGEMINHGFAADMKDAAEKAINAGLDMDMVANAYVDYLQTLVLEGKVTESKINEACKNIVRIKYRLGLFSNPYPSVSQEVKYAPEHLDAALHTAEESAVLLKNNGVLPLKNAKKILLCGPMADAPHDQLGTWVFDGEKSHTVTPLASFKKTEFDVTYIPGLRYSRDNNTSKFAETVRAAKSADVIIFVGGEESILSGEAHCLSNLNLQGAQSALLEALKQTGKPVVAVIMAGRPLTITNDLKNCDAMLYMFHPGTMGGDALVNLVLGKVSPSGKTPVCFPKTSGQVPVYYGQNNTGRPASGHEILLDDIPAEAGQTSLGCTSYMLDTGFGPLFDFGFGLSYTEFAFSDFKVNKTDFSGENDEIKVSFSIKNTGNCDGAEVAQVYVRDLVASITRPIKELKGFKKVFLQKGEQQNVEISIPLSSLKFYGLDDREVLEKGTFEIWLATSSADNDIKWKTKIEVK